jgi:hypothetical protein
MGRGSARRYRDLENGLIPRPSTELLETVARALRLPPDERRALWILAAGTSPPVGSYTTAANPGLDRLIEISYPQPAIIVDGALNILGYNDAVAECMVDFDTVPREDRNWIKWAAGHPHARHVFPDWGEFIAGDILPRLRGVVAKFPDSAEVSALIDYVRTCCDCFDEKWLADADLYFDPPTVRQVVRAPGHTDPEQPNDTDYHLTIDIVGLGSLRPGDERRILWFLFPPEHEHQPGLHSQEACLACKR